MQFVGTNTFYVYAVDSTTFKYEILTGQGPGNTAVELYTNVEGGYGFFGSATLDSVTYFVEAPDVWTRILTDSLKAELDRVKDSLNQAWEEAQQ